MTAVVVKTVWQDLECGLHSNIPLCCVLFYIICRPWQHWQQNYNDWTDKIDLYRKQEHFYSTCPLCLLFRIKPSKIKLCDCAAPYISQRYQISLDEARTICLTPDFDWISFLTQ